VDISDWSLSLEPFQEYQLTATAYPEDAFNREISWSSDHPEIAEVNEEGLGLPRTDPLII
jgi:uncharacterized protein YjdB